MNESDNPIASELAKAIAVLCVRNTFLEDLHAGTTPSSKAGDYSDVKVVTPYGEIPWQQLSRINFPSSEGDLSRRPDVSSRTGRSH